MQRSFVIASLLLLSLISNAQNDTVSAEAKSFIPKGYEPLDYITGDLNGDKKPDAILVLKQPGEGRRFEEDSLNQQDTVENREFPRPFIILIRQESGKLKQVLRNDSVILCAECGGVFGDPYFGTSIENNGFSIYFYGGSSWRWASNYSFKWKPAKKNWYLVKEYQTAFHMTDPNHPTKDATIGETEIGDVSIERFNSEPVYEDSRWKVKAVKTFFYNSPKLGSQPRKGYLLKGNIVTGIRHLKNFIEVSFDSGKGVFTDGYILKKDLEKTE
ncbi:MAG TPA: hypothetical protein VK483_13695 [Chitinophagaceae bacterium]|nr:hypothetical protein [Chitinophagaceae bacterium]